MHTPLAAPCWPSITTQPVSTPANTTEAATTPLTKGERNSPRRSGRPAMLRIAIPQLRQYRPDWLELPHRKQATPELSDPINAPTTADNHSIPLAIEPALP